MPLRNEEKFQAKPTERDLRAFFETSEEQPSSFLYGIPPHPSPGGRLSSDPIRTRSKTCSTQETCERESRLVLFLMRKRREIFKPLVYRGRQKPKQLGITVDSYWKPVGARRCICLQRFVWSKFQQKRFPFSWVNPARLLKLSFVIVPRFSRGNTDLGELISYLFIIFCFLQQLQLISNARSGRKSLISSSLFCHKNQGIKLFEENYPWRKCSAKLTSTPFKVLIHQTDWLQLLQEYLEYRRNGEFVSALPPHIIWIFSRKATIWILGSSKVVINSSRKCCKSKCTHDSCFSTSCRQKQKP